MASALPLRPSPDHSPRDRSVLDLADARTGAVFEALGSETARSIVAALNDAPATASDLSDRLDTTLQNVNYHLDRLGDADLVAAVDTWYSEKGREMTVYGVTADELVVRADGHDDPTAPSVTPPS